MELKIEQDFILLGSKSRPGKKHKKHWIVIHETGNHSPTADAKNHAIFLKRLAAQNKQYLSWNYTVDDKVIIQHIPDEEISWNAGDGQKDSGGNMSGISIEICVNQGSDFNKALDNAALLTGHLLIKHNLVLANIKQHYDFSGKNCPQTIRETHLWPIFLKKCENSMELLKNKLKNQTKQIKK